MAEAKKAAELEERTATYMTRILRHIHIIQIALIVVILAGIFSVFWFHKHMENDHRLFVESLIRSRLCITQAHLLFDEIAHHHDPQHGVQLLMQLLDETERYFQFLLQEQKEITWFYVPFDKARVQGDILELRELLRMFKEDVKKQSLPTAATDPDMLAHRQHDLLFERFDKKMSGTQQYLATALNREAGVFGLFQKYLIVFVVAAGILLGVLFGGDIQGRRKSDRQKAEVIGSLQSMNTELESIVNVSSHDLRSPLLNIQGFAQELATDCRELVDIIRTTQVPPDVEPKLASIIQQDIPQALQYITLSAARMDSLLKGLLKLSRLGRAALNIEPLDMNRLIDEIVKTMQYRITQQQVEVSVGRLPPCLGDEGQITQVFGNLLDNALKYVGGEETGRISISATVEGNYSIYCVRDNGIGISPQNHSRIFEIFHRLDTAEAVSGEGLGLTIVKRIVERHNGRVRVESECGKGSSFYIILPHPEKTHGPPINGADPLK